ncbi:MAG: protein kinase [Deltaproteobacteria bacterium]|nr:protein kinase [Deltaproteobacteria bacterium]
MGLIRSATIAAVLLTALTFAGLPQLGAAQAEPSAQPGAQPPIDRNPFPERFRSHRALERRTQDPGASESAQDAGRTTKEHAGSNEGPAFSTPGEAPLQTERDRAGEKPTDQRYRSIAAHETSDRDLIADAAAERKAEAELDKFRGTAARRSHAKVWHPATDPEEINQRIDALTPTMLDPPPPGLLPLSARRELTSTWARLLESLADFEGAKASYAHSLELGAATLPNWRGLGRMCARTGELENAEAVFLAARQFAETTDAVDDYMLADVYRELGELYLATGHPEDAVAALDQALKIVPGAVRAQQLWTLAVAETEGVAAPDDLATRVQPWPPTRAEHWRAAIEGQLDGVLAFAPDGFRQAIQGSASSQTAFILGSLIGALSLLWLAMRLLRKTGDLVVEIRYPDELEGLFSVHLANAQGRHRRTAGPDAGPHVRRKSTRTSHYSVKRETHFLRLPAHRYWVTVHGVLNDPEKKQALSEPWEEQSIDVAGNETIHTVFDLSPRECPVDVTVRWDKRDPGEVGVAARGLPQSLRYAQDGNVRLRLPMGSHTVMVGSGDRIAEIDVEVQSFQPTSLEINLAESELLVFKGCPPAVEPYLHGDLSGSARALERDGHSSIAHLLLARLYREQGQPERAAEQLESAGHKLEAAKMHESLSDFERAGALFESAGNTAQAAASYRSAGDFTKAGELFQTAGDLAKAADCFEKAGRTESLVGVMELQGRFFDAAHVANQAGDRARSVRLLQQVNRADESYADACMELVSAFEHEGHADLAASKLEDFLSTVGSAATPDLHSQLAELFAKADAPQKALEVLEALREQEPTYPNIASRIDALRKLVSGRRMDEGADGSTATFVAAQRYEIIEEVGRGGMGLIYKALDRRLNRIVALKRLPENLRDHPKALQLFLNEAQAAARLNHPNIVTVFDTDQEDGTFFITMELLQGYPLNVILKQRSRLGPRDTARIGSQVARGLQYAHDQQVVHRDIKTANLFLTHEKVVKIMDFGLAKMMEEVRRGSTVIGGTPSYMAPEQATGDRVDHRADLYSLGITLFELAVGHVPFQKGEVAYHHRHTEPPDPRSLADGIPDALAELILQLLRKDPDARCGSAEEVQKRLECIIEG